ncbi:MAG: membrane dipeptidase, partial [candidate division KSB1 bacterium]|nr:membrane dipeptidase [candidate division KSB1 bacterium]
MVRLRALGWLGGLVCLAACGVWFLGAVVQGPDWRRLHAQCVVADGHNDVLLRVLRGYDLRLRHKDGHIDLPRLKEGGVDLVFFACFPSPQYISRGPEDPDSCAWVVRRMIDSLRAQARRNG